MQGFMSNAALVPYEVQVWSENSVKFLGAGMRLAVIRWKTVTDKDTGSKISPKAAMCISIPAISQEVEIEPACLKETVIDYLQGQQDLILRKIIDNHFAENSNTTLKEIVVNPAFLNINGLAAFYNLNATNGKVSEVQIAEWFMGNIKDELELRLSNVAGMTDVVLKKAVEQHKMLLMRLASPKAVISEKIAEQLLKVVMLNNEDFSGVKEALVRKLGSFKAKEEELLASL